MFLRSLGVWVEPIKTTARSIRDTKIGQDDRRNVQEIVVVLSHERLIVADALLEFFLHEEDVGYVPRLKVSALRFEENSNARNTTAADGQLPGLIFTAEFSRLAEDFFLGRGRDSIAETCSRAHLGTFLINES